MLTLGSQVEVRCHLDCPWTVGWVVAGVVNEPDGPCYRVRRLGHDHPLGILLSDDFVRPLREFASTFA